MDPLTAARIQAARTDPAVLEKAERLARTTGDQPQKSTETVRIAMLGGSSVSIKKPYFLKRAQKRRRKGGRGKSGNGVYPILAVLGIQQQPGREAAPPVGAISAGNRSDWGARLHCVLMSVYATRRQSSRDFIDVVGEALQAGGGRQIVTVPP